jgi:hypothetical protein
LSAFNAELKQRWEEREAQASAKEAEIAAERAAQVVLARERDLAELAAAEEARAAKAAADSGRSDADRRERERLLMEYGYDDQGSDEVTLHYIYIYSIDISTLN